uniref:Elongation of very long chain fatty acids protein n=2 Tax=Hirondellea gigas TaxID=1518452 RepID=A0A2P2I5L6_9CRUS
MASIVTVVQHEWQRAQDQYSSLLALSDKRVTPWPLMSSPMPTVVLVACYLTMVKVGPALMKNREAFDLRRLLIFYNIAITFLNLYIGLELSVVSYRLGYSWFCQPVDYSDKPDEIRIAAALWWYYMSKLIEFCDTVFFILRKKNSQLTFLHIYHHSTMFTLWWIGVKYVAGGSSFLAAMMNSFVHVIMYSYYGLSALGPWIHPYLWWKRHITCIQLVQFSSAGVLGVRALIVGCSFPLWMQYALVIYMFSFIVLFGKFYVDSYRKKVKCIGQNGTKVSSNGTAAGTGKHHHFHHHSNSHRSISGGVGGGGGGVVVNSSGGGSFESAGSSKKRSANGMQTRARTRKDGRSRRDV